MCFGAGTEQAQIAGQDNAQAATMRGSADTMLNNVSAAGGQVAAAGNAQAQTYGNQLPNLINQYDQAAGINNGQPATSNAYALTPAQQQQLNSQLDAINIRQRSDAAALQAHGTAQGISDPNHYQAALQNLNESYGQMAADHTANFMEQARQGTLSSVQNLMGFDASQQQLGTQDALAGYGLQANAAAGVGDLAGQTQSAANEANQVSLGQQQQSNAIAGGLLSGAFKLGGAALGGAFSGDGTDNSGSGNTDQTLGQATNAPSLPTVQMPGATVPGQTFAFPQQTNMIQTPLSTGLPNVMSSQYSTMPPIDPALGMSDAQAAQQ